MAKNEPTKSRAPSLSKNPPIISTGNTTGSRFGALAFSLLTRDERPGPSPVARSCPTVKAIDGSRGFWSRVRKVAKRRAISLRTKMGQRLVTVAFEGKTTHLA